MKDNPEYLAKLIKNIYKVLLTRAMRGCFIFCHDPKLQDYIRSCLPKGTKNYYEIREDYQLAAEKASYSADSAKINRKKK